MRHFLANEGDDGGVMKESTIEHLFHVSVPLDDIKTSQNFSMQYLHNILVCSLASIELFYVYFCTKILFSFMVLKNPSFSFFAEI
jgi:hypothetical protein